MKKTYRSAVVQNLLILHIETGLNRLPVLMPISSLIDILSSWHIQAEGEVEVGVE